MNKRVLIVTEAGKSWPSGWVRALIYKDIFSKYSILVRFKSRQWPWLCKLVEKRGKFINILYLLGLRILINRLQYVVSKVREFLIIRECRNDYDVIYLQKAGSYSLALKLRKYHKGRIVFDLNDALWLPANSNYAQGKIREILILVDAVTCDNYFGFNFAAELNPNTFIVPDPAQVEAFDQFRIKHKSKRKKSGEGSNWHKRAG